METKKLTVNQFAALVGVSSQAVYKQIHNANSKLQQYITYDGRNALIDELAAVELYHITQQPIDNDNNPIEQPNQPIDNQINQPNQPIDNDNNQPNQPNQPTETTALLAVIDILRAQISEKDKQINTLLAANTELATKLTETMTNAQALQSQANYLLLANNQPPADQPQPIDADTAADENVDTDTAGEQQPKTNIFIKFFNWLNS